MFRDAIFKTLEGEARKLKLVIVGKQEFRGNLLLHSLDKIGRRLQIQRHYNSAAEQAPVERRNPFRAILAPEEHAVAMSDLAGLEFTSKLKGD
jgi:hypothetical protein